MQNLARNGFSYQDVSNALHNHSRALDFRFDLLDNNNQILRALDNVLESSVTLNVEGEIKRTAKFSIVDDDSINFLSQRIKPYARVLVTGQRRVLKPATWKRVVNMTPVTDGMEKTGGENLVYDAALTSSEVIDSRGGYAEFTAATVNGRIVLGLGSDNPEVGYTTISHAIHLSGTSLLQIFENGTSKGTVGTYVVGDVIRVTVEEGVVRWYKNDNLIYTSSTTPPSPLYFRASVATVGTVVSNVRMTQYGAQTDWVEFPLGVFLLSTPTRRSTPTGTVTREIEAYDQLQILKDDKVTGRYLVASGTSYTAAIKSLMDTSGIVNQNIAPSTKTMPVDREWEAGSSKLTIINELLSALNYDALFFDEDGIAVCRPYVTPDSRTSEYTYADDSRSVIFPDSEETLDWFSVPNQFVLVVSQVDRPVLKSVYTNSSSASPTSTVSRGRTIVEYMLVDAADQATLDGLAQAAAFKASQVYQTITMQTALMPHHSHNDILTIVLSNMDINAKYEEIGWTMVLKAGARMSHTVRRVVTV
jgi:hypothetical protein